MLTKLTMLPPLSAFVFLLLFAVVLWRIQVKSTQDRGLDTKDHSERVYKLFEFYIKIMLAITGALGYTKFSVFANNPKIGREAMLGLGGISIGVMTMFVIILWCHQGSKLRRWKNIEWGKMPFWLELWMGIGMFTYSTAIWMAAVLW